MAAGEIRYGSSGAEVDLNQLQELLAKLGAKGDFFGWYSSRKEENSRIIDMLDWNSLLDDRAKCVDSSWLLAQQRKLEPLLQNFTTEEKQLKQLLQWKGVCLLADAEQTYFQPAISKLTLDMQRIYNRENVVIFNTYQSYLKEVYHNITMAVELSRRERFVAKLVRGAYMYLERERVQKIGYEDLIMSLLIECTTGQAGLPVYKYVPYGPMNEGMPYLSQRAQENRGFMKGTQKERELLWKELKRRLASEELHYRPILRRLRG